MKHTWSDHARGAGEEVSSSLAAGKLCWSTHVLHKHRATFVHCVGRKELFWSPVFWCASISCWQNIWGQNFIYRTNAKWLFSNTVKFPRVCVKNLILQSKLITSFHMCSVPKKSSSSKLHRSLDSWMTVEFTGLLQFGAVFNYLSCCTSSWRSSLPMTDPKVGWIFVVTKNFERLFCVLFSLQSVVGS